MWILKSWPKSATPGHFQRSEATVTLVIPCRNEETNIPRMLAGLNTLAKGTLEVIVVDDHSEDDTSRLLEEAAEIVPNLLVLSNIGEGKKAAIELAVSQARGELIFTTDADCRWTANWIDQMKSAFTDPSIQLVAGPVLPFYPRSGRNSFELIDWASIVLMTQFSFLRGKPLMCSGANLAYRKSSFDRVHGFQGNKGVLSGDDEFLLKKIVQEYGSSAVKYQNSKNHLVQTLAQPNGQALINQRVRWASKWRMHKEVEHALSAIATALLQVFWVSSFVLLVQGWSGLGVFSICWFLKIFGEYKALGTVLADFDQSPSFKDFARASLFHPVFVLRIGVGTLFGKFVWKGRSTPRNSIFA